MQLPLHLKEDIHHSPQNPREAFLYYISRMEVEVEMAGLVVEDHRTHQDARKSVLLEKLSKATSKFTQ